jgi:hypothetical protein
MQWCGLRENLRRKNPVRVMDPQPEEIIPADTYIRQMPAIRLGYFSSVFSAVSR